MTALHTPARPRPGSLGHGGAGPAPLRLGSMCSGYEGLGMAVAQVLDVELAWVADNDPGASAILAHRMPDVPNLGDITQVTWEDAVRVDVLAAGFPCTDLSFAGQGAGIRKGTRSGLWFTIADAIDVLRPGLVILENVRAIVTRRPGLDVVLADLARLGFDAEWTCNRASDIGAPHRRERWWLVAHPADQRHERGRLARRRRPGPADGDLAAAHASCAGRQGKGPAVADRRPLAAVGAAADADCGGLPRDPECDLWPEGGIQAPSGHDADGRVLDWGRYGPAVDRWARFLGRPAPDPTEPGRNGQPRLNPVFVEWMQGLDRGHVTAVPGLTRNQMLKALGNGVVPQQGAAALACLLDRITPHLETA